MKKKEVIGALMLATLVSGLGWSQETPPPAALEEPGQAAASTVEDDELTADEKAAAEEALGREVPYKSWSELVDFLGTPRPFPKRYVVRVDDKYAYPHIVASFKMEFIREDDEYIWLRGISPEDPNSPLYKLWAQRQVNEARVRDVEAALETPGALNFVDFAAVEVPPPFMESLRFVSEQENLPVGGLWQMGFAVADMNEDGHQDLIFPPKRKGMPPAPSIFIGDGTGKFIYWVDAKWPPNVPWDYGGVAVADFDGDGHQDAAFAIHFKAQYVLYGDGKGNFPRGEKLQSPDPRLTSRAVTAADFDGDGRQDLAFVVEVDYDLTTSARVDGAQAVWVMFNRDDGWEMVTEGLPLNRIADVIRAADLDGDGNPEIVVSSNSFARREFVFHYRSFGGWEAGEERGNLSNAYHNDVEPVDGELFATFVQFRRIGSQTEARNGLVRYPPATGDEEFVIGHPVIWDKERADVFYRLGVGDLNGDGLTDLVAGRRRGGLEVYLQMETGEFVRETSPELAEVGRAFDIRLLDLDGDGLDDIVIGCAPEQELPGGIRVWLTRSGA